MATGALLSTVDEQKVMKAVPFDPSGDGKRPSGPVQTLALDVSPTGDHFATAGSDACIRIYDERTTQFNQLLMGYPSI